MVIYLYAVLVIYVACGVSGVVGQIDVRLPSWYMLHFHARLERNLDGLIWASTVADEAKAFVNQCAWSEAVARRNDSLLVMSIFNDYVRPRDIMEYVAQEQVHVKNGTFQSCCGPDSQLCCSYAKIMTTTRTYFGCFSKFCRVLHHGRFDIENAYFGLCRYK